MLPPDVPELLWEFDAVEGLETGRGTSSGAVFEGVLGAVTNLNEECRELLVSMSIEW